MDRFPDQICELKIRGVGSQFGSTKRCDCIQIANCDARFGDASFVAIVEDIPATIAGPVLVNASSAIQYISDYRGTIARLVALAPICFIVSLTPFTDGPTYARQQLNIPHKKLATWVFNRTEFISEMTGLGYSLSFTVDHDLPITYGNAPGASSFASMVFRSGVRAQ